MKFIHLSDLHLGKSVHEFSLLEDQEYILLKILEVVDGEKPQCVLISGDVFDRTVAPTEALHLFDDFLVGLVKRGVEVFVISGNHDSADRLSFASRLIDESGVHISRAYDGVISPSTVFDEHGEIDIYLLPFLKPVQVKRFFPEKDVDSWTDALSLVIGSLPLDNERRNILLAHQFVTGAARTESEEINVGGADNVDVTVFEPFDYVALGHLHAPQSIGRETVRYCGTPLKYSFSEADQEKSVTVVELGEKGHVVIRQVPLVPKRDMVELRGSYLEVTAKDYYESLNRDDYCRITLTDEDDQPDALAKLRIIYPNIMRLDYDNKRTRTESTVTGAVDASKFTPLELFETLYGEQNHRELTELQSEHLSGLIEDIWGAAK